MAQLQVMPGEKIQTAYWVIDESTYHRPTKIKIFYADFSKPKQQNLLLL